MSAPPPVPLWLQLTALDVLVALLAEASDPSTDLESRVEIADLLLKVHPAGLALATAITTKGNDHAPR